MNKSDKCIWDDKIKLYSIRVEECADPQIGFLSDFVA